MIEVNVLIDLQGIKIKVMVVKDIITWTEEMDLDRQERLTQQMKALFQHRVGMVLNEEDTGPETIDLMQLLEAPQVQIRLFHQEDMDLEEVCRVMLKEELDQFDLGLHPKKRPRNGGTKILERKRQSIQLLQLKPRRMNGAIEDPRRSRLSRMSSPR